MRLTMKFWLAGREIELERANGYGGWFCRFKKRPTGFFKGENTDAAIRILKDMRLQLDRAIKVMETYRENGGV